MGSDDSLLGGARRGRRVVDLYGDCAPSVEDDNARIADRHRRRDLRSERERLRGREGPARSTIIFLISNRGKKLHNFTVLGKKTPLIKPKHTARLVVNLLSRGAFPYRSTVDKGPRFRGHFIVY